MRRALSFIISLNTIFSLSCKSSDPNSTQLQTLGAKETNLCELGPEIKKQPGSYAILPEPIVSYNAIPFSKDLAETEKLQRVASGQYVRMITTPLKQWIQPGDIMVQISTESPLIKDPSKLGFAVNKDNFKKSEVGPYLLDIVINRGMPHAAIFGRKQTDGQSVLFHLDSPKYQSGPLATLTGQLFHIFRVRPEQFPKLDKNERIARLNNAVLRLESVAFGYDKTLKLDVIAEGCKQLCAQIEQGHCPKQYCSELIFSALNIAGVTNLYTSSWYKEFEALEDKLMSKIKPTEAASVRSFLVGGLSYILSVPSLKDPSRSLVKWRDSWTNSERNIFLAQSNGAIFLPHHILESALGPKAPLCYVGTYQY